MSHRRDERRGAEVGKKPAQLTVVEQHRLVPQVLHLVELAQQRHEQTEPFHGRPGKACDRRRTAERDIDGAEELRGGESVRT